MHNKFAAIFRRYPHKTTSSLLFPGCYFPIKFPRATRALKALAAQHGVACAFDCCGKPQQKIGRHIGPQLQRLQVRELITVCPNCYEHLQGNLSVPVHSIYDKLTEWGVMQQNEATGEVFIPCPDRRQEQLQQIRQILPNYQLEPIASVPCCGLGGAFIGNKIKAQQFSTKVKQQLDGTLYTYCASCAGQFQRQGIRPVRHLLAEILGVEENPGRKIF